MDDVVSGSTTALPGLTVQQAINVHHNGIRHSQGHELGSGSGATTSTAAIKEAYRNQCGAATNASDGNDDDNAIH
jgi:hypothetical protein